MLHCPKCNTAIGASAPPARPPMHKPEPSRSQDRMAAHRERDHLRLLAEKPEPIVDDVDLRFRRRAYLRHIRSLEAALPELHPAYVRTHVEETLAFAEVDRILYEATLARYEDERRTELTKSNLEVARQQIELGARLAGALEEIRRLTAYAATPRANRSRDQEEANMSEAESMIQRRDAERLRVLRSIFDMTGGSERRYVLIHRDDNQLCHATGLDQDAMEEAITWLEGEGLIEHYSIDSVKLTHEGLREVENSIRHPERDTAHFTPTVIKMSNNFYGPVGAFQTGNDASANVQQNLAAARDREKALAEIDAVAERVAVEAPEKKDQALVLAESIKAEMAKPAPKLERVTVYTQLLTAMVSAAPTVEHLIRMLFGTG